MTLKDFLFSKKHGSIYYKYNYNIKYKLPFSRLWHQFHNPYYYWWKVRNLFKRPKAHFHAGETQYFFGFPCNKSYLNKVLDIRLSGLGWKSKFDSPRHEWDPYISIVFFRKWQLLWIFNWVDLKEEHSHTRSMATWEAILDIVVFKKGFEETIGRHTWQCYKYGNKVDVTIDPNLKK